MYKVRYMVHEGNRVYIDEPCDNPLSPTKEEAFARAKEYAASEADSLRALNKRKYVVSACKDSLTVDVTEISRIDGTVTLLTSYFIAPAEPIGEIEVYAFTSMEADTYKTDQLVRSNTSLFISKPEMEAAAWDCYRSEYKAAKENGFLIRDVGIFPRSQFTMKLWSKDGFRLELTYKTERFTAVMQRLAVG